MFDALALRGREQELFTPDMSAHENTLVNLLKNGKLLVLGGAGSIGQAVTKQIFKHTPNKHQVVDISENDLVESVLDIRSSFGNINGDLQTYASPI